MEEFRETEYTSYLVSNIGRVNGLREIMKLQTFKPEYKIIGIELNGRLKSLYVHRLVEKAFIPNPKPDIYTNIDHIDEDKSNNHVDNLRWYPHWKNCL